MPEKKESSTSFIEKIKGLFTTKKRKVNFTVTKLGKSTIVLIDGKTHKGEEMLGGFDDIAKTLKDGQFVDGSIDISAGLMTTMTPYEKVDGKVKYVGAPATPAKTPKVPKGRGTGCTPRTSGFLV